MARENHTGAMIALVPSDTDVDRLAVPGGESPDELHLTLYYVGDAAAISDEARDQILDAVVQLASDASPVTGEAFAVSVFNPPGFERVDGADSDMCVVVGVGDPTGKLVALKGAVEEIFSGRPMGFDLPRQHSPWVPHLTLAYTEDTDISGYLDRTGPVIFDRLRVTFGGDVYDVPLDEDTDENDVTAEEFDEMLAEGESVDVEVDDDGEVIVPNVLLDLRAWTEGLQRERDVTGPGPGGHNLRNYWVRGKGAAKVRWGTEGSMRRCIRNLREYVRDPGGLCAEYHRLATGEWPRGGTVPSESDVETFHGDEHHSESHSDDTLYRTNRATEGESDVPRQLELAVVIEPDESGGCPPGYSLFGDGRCIRFPDTAETEDMAGGMPVPSETEIPETKCPPGHHRMPDGECMPDLEMTEDDTSDDDDAYVVTPTWEGVLTVEGVESGDGRMFMPGSLTWEDPPLPLMWQKETAHGGENRNVSVRVGSITGIWREDDPNGRADVKIIKGRGVLDVGNPDGAEVFRRMNADPPFLNSNSVDVDSIKNADVEMRYPEVVVGEDTDGEGTVDGLKALFAPPELTVFRRGRVRGTTFVEFPAFVEATLALTDTASEPPVVAAGEEEFGATTSHRTATVDGPWSGPTHEKRLPSPMTRATASRVYAYLDYARFTGDGEVPKSAGKLPHHNVSADGTPGPANLTAVSAAVAALNGARGGVHWMSSEDRRGAYEHLARHLRDAGREPPPLRAVDTDVEALVAATHVMSVPDTPPREWFTEPTDVAPRGALTITDEGRVYGYLAPTNVRHRSFHHKAVYTPLKKVDYSRFHGGETIVADGGRVTTGVITMNCGHATTDHDLTASEAMDHYDNSCSLVASVRVGENKHGVWVAGALLPDVEPRQVQRIMGCRLSGDWRAHLDRPGWRELAAALLVPVPGFPMARSAPSVEMTDGQLVASSTPVRFARVHSFHGNHSQKDHGNGIDTRDVVERDEERLFSDRLTALRARVASVSGDKKTEMTSVATRIALEALKTRIEALHGAHD